MPTLRYYEGRGLIVATRDAGGRRRFPRHTLRRLAVVAAGQRVGLSLEEIRTTTRRVSKGAGSRWLRRAIADDD